MVTTSHHIAAELARERQRDVLRSKRSSGLFRRRDKALAEPSAEAEVERTDAVRLGVPGQRPGRQAPACASSS